MGERMMWLKGDRVKTITEPYVTGIVVKDLGERVMIEDDFSGGDYEIEFQKKDLEVFKGGKYHQVEGNTWKEIIGY